MSTQAPLKPLHPDSSLSPVKLAALEKLTTDSLKKSLAPGQKHCLKAKANGTMMDGHHRIHILKRRGVNVNTLPRELVG